MGVSILSDGVGKPFSVRPAADDFPIFLHLILFPEKFFVKQWHINLSLNGYISYKEKVTKFILL